MAFTPITIQGVNDTTAQSTGFTPIDIPELTQGVLMDDPAIKRKSAPSLAGRFKTAGESVVGLPKHGIQKVVSGLKDIGGAFTSGTFVKREGQDQIVPKEQAGQRSFINRLEQAGQGLQRIGAGGLTTAFGVTPVGAVGAVEDLHLSHDNGIPVINQAFGLEYALGLPFVAPVSAYRALKKDPKIYFKRIAGEIYLGSRDERERKKVFGETLENLAGNVQNLRENAAGLKKYYGRVYGGVEDSTDKSEPIYQPNLKVPKHARRKDWVIVIGSRERHLYGSEKQEDLQKILSWVEENQNGILSGEVREFPSEIPYSFIYNEYLVEMPKDLEGRRDGYHELIGRLKAEQEVP